MKDSTKKRIKTVCPEVIWRIGHRLLRRGIRWDGPFSSWQQALARTTGYDAPVIASRCIKAALQVRDGHASFEQDTVLFTNPDPIFSACTAILLAAQYSTNGSIRVFDFGGSLGSLYYRCRPVLDSVRTLEWIVVEQAFLVSEGQKHLQDGRLQFFDSIESAAASGKPLVVSICSVLPYIENSMSVLKRLIELDAAVIYIDRTQFAVDDVERVFVQHVNEKIYPASYPVRFLSWSTLASLLDDRYNLLHAYDSWEGRIRSGRHKAQYRGGLWLRRDLANTEDSHR